MRAVLYSRAVTTTAAGIFSIILAAGWISALWLLVTLAAANHGGTATDAPLLPLLNCSARPNDLGRRLRLLAALFISVLVRIASCRCSQEEVSSFFVLHSLIGLAAICPLIVSW